MSLTITKAKNLRHATMSIFSQIKNQSGKISIIVPDKLTLSIEQKLFEYLDIESSFDIEVITLTRLSQKVLTELNVEYSPISKIGSIVLMKNILSKHSNELTMFNSPSFSYNYSDALFKTLTQFKASQISYLDMNYEDIPFAQLRNKIHDLKILLENYETLKAGYIDSCDRLNLFSTAIHKSDIVKNTHFYFLGFDDFTSQGYNVIEQLVKNALSVNVAVYFNSSKNSQIYSTEVESQLKRLAHLCMLPYNEISLPYEDDNLHTYLADNLSAISSNNFTTDQVKLVNTLKIEDQIDYVARTIRKQIINGANYYDFGVACYELDSYKDIIANIFDKYELNYYIDSQTPLSHTNYFKFFTNYLRLFINKFQKENLIEFINSDFIDFDLNIKIKMNRQILDSNFSGHLKYICADDELKPHFEYFANLLNNFPISQNSSLEEIKQTFSSISEYLQIEDKMTLNASLTNNLHHQKILQQAPNSFDQLMDEISKFYSDATAKEVLDILVSSGKEQKISPIPQSIDTIQVLDAGEILTEFDNLFIINCTHQTCPSILQDVGIILDKDILNLNLNKKLSPTIAHLNKINRFKAWNSLQMFNKTLTITMTTKNDNEKSEFIKDLETKLTTKDEYNQVVPLAVSNFTNEFSSYELLSKWDLVEYLSQNNNKFSDEVLENYGLKRFEPQEQLNINSPLNFDEISCSALENYFKCPMMYFLANTLKIKEERQEGIAMVDVGNIIHELAKDFYRYANRKNFNVPKFCQDKIKHYMEQDKKLNTFINTPIHLNLVKEAIRFLNHLNYLDETNDFIPAFQEYPFDSKFNRSIPLTNEVYLRGKIDRIDFYDFPITDADTMKYVRIIDYKTGNVDASLKELFYGKKLQLFLYGKLAETIFDRKLAGSFYMPIKNSMTIENKDTPYKLVGYYLNDNNLIRAFDTRMGKNTKSDLLSLSLNKDGEIKVDSRSNKILNNSDFTKLTNYAVEISKTAINEIKSGYIKASPIKFDEQSNSCGYCPYLAICRKNSSKIKFRETTNINLDSFGGAENG